MGVFNISRKSLTHRGSKVTVNIPHMMICADVGLPGLERRLRALYLPGAFGKSYV